MRIGTPEHPAIHGADRHSPLSIAGLCRGTTKPLLHPGKFGRRQRLAAQRVGGYDTGVHQYQDQRREQTLVHWARFSRRLTAWVEPDSL
jgi:hypothetical protein